MEPSHPEILLQKITVIHSAKTYLQKTPMLYKVSPVNTQLPIKNTTLKHIVNLIKY